MPNIIHGSGGSAKYIGDAVESNVLSGKKFYSKDKTLRTGTIPSLSAKTYTPTTTNQTIASEQYINGTQTILGDADLLPKNIKSDISLFGVVGIFKDNGLIAKTKVYPVNLNTNTVLDLSEFENIDNIILQENYDVESDTDWALTLDRTNKKLTVKGYSDTSEPTYIKVIEWNCKKWQTVYASWSDTTSYSKTIEATPTATYRYIITTSCSCSSEEDKYQYVYASGGDTILRIGTKTNSSEMLYVAYDPNATEVHFSNGSKYTSKTCYAMIIDV